MKTYKITATLAGPDREIVVTASTPLAAARKIVRGGRRLSLDDRFDHGNALGVSRQVGPYESEIACRVEVVP